MEFKYYRAESKKDYGTHSEKLSIEQIQTGALLRIADAVELMAQNYTAMQNDVKFYKERCNQLRVEIERLNRKNAALRGHLTKLKTKNKLPLAV